MSGTDELTLPEEIRMGVANACVMFPDTSERRREEIERLHHLADEEKAAVAKIKAESGFAEHKTRLSKIYGVAKATQQIMRILDGIKKPGDRAAVLTQVGLFSQDVGYLDKDLVTQAQEAAATTGQQGADEGSLFDKTSEGQRRGGAKAQPKLVEVKAGQALPPAPTPGIPLDEALARFEEAKAAAGWGGKGFVPKALKPFKEAVDAARAAETENGTTASLRDANKAGDDHIRDQVAKHDGKGAQTDEAPQPPTRKSKGKAEKAPAAAPPAADDLDEEIPDVPPRQQEHRGLGPDAIH